MTKTIEELKLELIQQAKNESEIDYNLIKQSLDEIIERVGEFMFDMGYDKGFENGADSIDEDELYEEDVADIYDLEEIRKQSSLHGHRL